MRAALVVQQPLPYVYVAREVLRSAGVPCQLFDTLPLAAEPYSAALDLVLSCVSANFARLPGIALLRSPHFRFAPPTAPLAARLAALDRALAEAGYLGDTEALSIDLLDAWRAAMPPRAGLGWPHVRAAGVAQRSSSASTRSAAIAGAVADHLRGLRRRFSLCTRARCRPTADPLASTAGARSGARDARLAARRVAAVRRRRRSVSTMWRRSCAGGSKGRRSRRGPARPACTWSTRRARVSASSSMCSSPAWLMASGRTGPRRNIFYSPAILRELGWPAESDRLDGCASRVRRSASAADRHADGVGVPPRGRCLVSPSLAR